MGKRLVRKRAADRDLTDQVEHIAGEHPAAARRYLFAVERAFAGDEAHGDPQHASARTWS